jgi:hypothetical protein
MEKGTDLGRLRVLEKNQIQEGEKKENGLDGI